MTHHAINNWHLEVTLVQATLRRYSGQDAQVAFSARAPYDAVVQAELRDGNAYLSAALAKDPELTRADRRVIEALLRLAGAETCTALRGGHTREILPETPETLETGP